MGLCQHAEDYWNEKNPHAREYIQYQHIRVAQRILLDEHWRVNYDQMLCAAPDPFYQRRITRRAICCFRCQGLLRLQQLQASLIWKTGPADENLEAVLDEFRHTYLHCAMYEGFDASAGGDDMEIHAGHSIRKGRKNYYVCDKPGDDFNVWTLQQMIAQSEQALLTERSAEHGSELERHLCIMRQYKLEDGLAILRKQQALFQLLHKVQQMSVEELQAYTETTSQRSIQERDKQVRASEEHKGMRENDKQESWEPTTYQQLYSNMPDPLWSSWQWSRDPDFRPSVIEVTKAEIRADLRALNAQLANKERANQHALTAIRRMRQEQLTELEDKAVLEALREEKFHCEYELAERRRVAHIPCKECRVHQTEACFPCEPDGRIARHQRCLNCAFPSGRSCLRRRRESEGPVLKSAKELHPAGRQDIRVWFCDQAQCQSEKQRKCSACKVTKPGREFARDGHHHHERCLSCEYPTCATCGFTRPRANKAVEERHKDNKRNWYCQPACRPKRS